jgi:galactitol-specific phosphotransferase system IIB component
MNPMSIKEKIQDVLKKYNINLSVEETATIELAATAKAADGSEIGTPTEFVAGAEIFVVIEGQPQVAPDGEIAMEDGTTIVVKEGKVEEVKPKVEEMSSDVVAAFEKIAERVSALEGLNASQTTELTAAKAKVEELTTKLSAAETKATNAEKKVLELSKQPAATSVKDKGVVELNKQTSASAPKAKHLMSPAERVAAKREELAQKN